MGWLAIALVWGMLGQEKVDEAAARALVVKQVEPVYPAAARAAHLTGDVVLALKVDPRGHVETVKVVSGPVLLRQAAMTAVKQWVFRPEQQGGVITSFTTELTVTFPAKKGGAAVAAAPVAVAAVPAAAVPAVVPARETPEQGVVRQFAALAAVCHRLVAERKDAAAQASACRDVAAKGEEFGPDTRFIERRSAYVFAATALLRNDEAPAAVLYGEKAVAVVKQGHDDAAGASAAYAVKGQAEAFAGNFAAADLDLKEAERLERKRVAEPGGRAEAGGLKQLLNLRSQVLRQLGRTAEANKLKAEAERRN